MLERLELENVGPAPAMVLDLAPRLNLITGDNGLGKSFLLDVAWWALTRKWPRDLNPRLASGYAARPTDVGKPAKLRFTVKTTTTGRKTDYESEYSSLDESWPGRPGRPWSPGLVIHAHADGGFSVWDPARNYWRQKGGIDVQDRLPGYVFSPEEVWNGLVVPIHGNSTRVCRGLLDDWSSWIREKGESADRMAEVVGMLTVSGTRWEVGPILRLSVDDAQDIPSIRTDYSDAVPIVHASSAVRRIAGLAYVLVWSWSEHIRAARHLGVEVARQVILLFDDAVPIVHASSAVRRIAGLAYVLVWSWSEHIRAARHLGVEVARQVILLFDEIEAHLHPRWQRAIVPAILKVIDRLTQSDTSVQLIATTHSPLILASVEPHFDEERDRLFHLDISDGKVRLDFEPWAKQGDALNWLVSDVFGLRQARSVEAERAIDMARRSSRC